MILETFLNVVDKTIERIVPDKNVQLKLKNAFKVQFLEMALREREILQRFFLEYEGRATEVPRAVLLMRTLIRPVFTWILGLMGIGWIVGQALGFVHEDMPEALQTWVNIVLGFWFGGRVLEKLSDRVMGNMKGR